MSKLFNPIAIIGMSGRFPGANNIDELLGLLLEGRDHVGPVNKERLIQTTLPLNGNYITGGLIDDVDKFDYTFFKYAPIEAKSMDPHLRISIENTYHCIEDSGYRPSFFKGTNTMVVASNATLNYYKHADEFEASLITGNDSSFIAAAISRQFGLHGQSLVVETSCSSSMSALQIACNSLILGDSDYALVISTGINLFPEKQSGISLGLESKEGKSKSFSAKADGMSFGEASVVLLLKPLDKAQKDNDQIHAVIKGIGVNNNGHLSTSPTAPESSSQTNLVIQTWEMAGINPRDIGFIEAHGSGTILGDSIELIALNKAFKTYTQDKHFCSVSTIKTNFGHTRSSSGLVGLSKAILSVKNGYLFKSLHFDEPNPLIDFENSAVKIQDKLQNWTTEKGSKRLAGITNIGLSGVNVHLVIEEAPSQIKKENRYNGPYLITISSHSEEGLRKKFQQLKNIAFENLSIEDVSYTLLSGRDHFQYRSTALVQNHEELKKFILNPIEKNNVKPNTPKLRLVFLSIQSGINNDSVIQFLKYNYPYYNEIFNLCIDSVDEKENPFVLEFASQFSFFKLLEKAGISTEAILAIGVGEWILKLINEETSLKEALNRIKNTSNFEIEQVEKRSQAMLLREKSFGFPVFIDLGSKESSVGNELLKFNKNDNSFAIINHYAHKDPFMAILFELYKVGGDLNYDYVANLFGGKRISLPLYPFEKTRCWIREAPRVNSAIEKEENNDLLLNASELEITIANLWKKFLELASISLEDNFFELGGTSLKASKIIIELNKTLELKLDFEDIFDFPTLKELANFVNQSMPFLYQFKLIWKKVLKVDEVNDQDNFFELGGHSLLTNNLINRVEKQFKIKLNFEDVFNHPTFISLTTFLIEKIENSAIKEFIEIKKIPEQDSYVLSSSQYRMWLLCQLDNASMAYNESIVCSVEGSINIVALENSFQKLIERHEILRTIFSDGETGNPRQYVKSLDEINFKIKYIDLSEDFNEPFLRSLIVTTISERFDLALVPLMRANLYRTSNEKHVIVFVIHHIISDGWSMNIFLKELFAFYNSFTQGGIPNPKPLRIQYKDYADWQQHLLSDESTKEHKNYWLNQFTGELPILNLPTDKIRPLIKTYNGSKIYKTIGTGQTQRIKALYRKLNATLFMGLLASINALLYRYTNQEDIILGSPIAGRKNADLEDQIGFYVNTLALRTQFNGEESFNELLERTKKITLGAYENQVYPFDELVDQLKLQRDMSRNALFDVMVVLQNNENHSNIDKEHFHLGDIIISPYSESTGHSISKFDLTFNFKEVNEVIYLGIEYNSDIYNKETIERLANHYENLLTSITINPSQKLNQIDYLSQEEKKQLLVTFNDTKADYPKDKTIIDLFEQQVKQTPNNIALVFEEKELTYIQLNEKANQLAHYLRETYHIQADDLVGILLERSEWMIISILGVLKSGAAYVPIDPEYPQERIDFMLQDSQCKTLINQQELDKFKEKQKSYNKKNLKLITKPNNLAYVIYTSGSTGKPKGVMVEHRNLVNLILFHNTTFNISTDEKIMLFTTISFDASVEQIWIALSTGSKLFVIDKKTILDNNKFELYLANNAITHLHATPSFLSNLNFQESTKLKRIISGGEICSNQLAEKWHQSCKFYNKYGPTESTVTAIEYIVNSTNHDLSLPIGRPIGNTQIYILNNKEQLQPIGIIGEICIGGDGLARGYLNRPDLTAEKFVLNPFKDGERIYKTGDLGRWLPDGNIEFIGRKDDQVKIRGYRIELGEIESVLNKHELINNSVVIAKSNQAGEKDLVAYITGKETLNTHELRTHLSITLPAYMVPSYFVQLDAIPLNANGKVDKKELPNPEGLGLSSGVEYIAPRNETEERLVKIWEEILDRTNIGIKDNFFELGGHSLKAMRLVSKIYKDLTVKLELKDLFTQAVLEQQARLIEQSQQIKYIKIPQLPHQSNYTLSSSQRRLWVLSQFEESNVAYNMPGVYLFEGDLKLDLLQKSFQVLIERHQSLRTSFKEDEQYEIKQFILPIEDVNFSIHYQNLPSNEQQKTLNTLIAKDFSKAFDLSQCPLLRTSVYELEKNKYIFTYVMHHIISDGWSMGILIKEVLTFYNAYLQNAQPDLKPLGIQYKDYAAWQQAQLQDESIQSHKTYWLNQLSGELPVLELPTDKPRPAVKTSSGASISTLINETTSNNLKALCQKQGSTLFMGLLASVNVLLYRYTNQEDIIIGSPIAGREHTDLEDQIGFYINTLALRSQFKGENSFETLLGHTKQITLDAYKHQSYPFDELVDELNLQRDMSRSALFDVMVVLQNTGDVEQSKHPQSLGNLKISPYQNATLQENSKFDLTFNFSETENGIYFNLQYNSDLYNKQTVERLATHLISLIKTINQSPSIAINQLTYLSKAETLQLVETFNDTKADYPKDKTIIDLFEQQVKQTPNNIALVFEDKELTYKELNEKANQLAHYLRETYRIKADDLVGILLERSEWMIIAILGVLKSGAAYVPIDPEYPQERIDFMLEDSQCKALINNEELDKFKINEEKFKKSNLKSINQANHLAYVIYTSGSTGKPKGVMVEHRSVIRLVKSTNYINLIDNTTLLSTGSLSFDATTFEYWSMLLNGGKLVICQHYVLLDNKKLGDEILRRKIDVMWFTSGWLNQLIDQNIFLLSELKTLVVGGDVLSPIHINKLQQAYPHLKIINGYGPTENTTFSLTYAINSIMIDIPIGKPINNSTAYIFDINYNTLQPIGVIGEICIGGDGLARGYLNRPDLTAEKFVLNPFKDGERIYKTGDLGRWLPDGNIEFIGRKDDQVKIRGYRIELGEIESVLNKHELINNSVVIAKSNQAGEKDLVAYITGKETLNTHELRTHLSITLPAYMVPSYFVQLDAIPLNANGKVDKKELPNPEGLGLSSGVEYIAPRNETEERLVKIWEEILDRTNIGIKDNFFELGGHSLKAMRLVSKIYKDLTVKLELKDLFTQAVLEQQARLIEQSQQIKYIKIPQLPHQSNYTLSSSQRRLWVLSQFEESNVAYNMPGVYLFEGDLKLDLLQKSFQVLIERHQSLRTSFKEDEQYEIKQFILPIEDVNFSIHYQNLPSNEQQKTLNTLIAKDFSKAFDLSQCPLLRTSVYELEKNKYIFTYVMHHIISDGWSMGILIKEVLTFYNAYLQNAQPDLKPLGIQYKDYAAWQQAQLQDESIQSHKTYWLNQLSGELPVLELPTDKPRPAVKTSSGASISTLINETTSNNLKALCQKQGSTLFMGLLASVNVLLYRYTNQEDIIIGSPIAGREHTDLEDQIGFYINTLALRSQFKGENSFETLLGHTKQITLDAYKHQSYPFDELVDELNLQRDMSRSALFDVMVVLQNTGDVEQSKHPQSLGNLKISPYQNATLQENSKFDLTFNFSETENGIYFNLQYNSDLYNKQTVERLATHLISLIKTINQSPSIAINQLTYLSKAETLQLVETFNDTKADYPKDKTIIDLFEQQVKQTPNNIALVFEDKELTYKELNEKANQLAHYLRETYHIQADDLVGILLERSEWMIMAILGVLKSGAAYVPIDPEYPQERIDFMLEDSQCKALINNEELDKFKINEKKFKKSNLKSINQANHLAYVIYTSGSTGKPKGVMVEHRSVSSFLVNFKNNLLLNNDLVLGSLTNYTFDISVLEIMGGLTQGIKLILLQNSNVEVIIKEITYNKITALQLTPSRLNQLMAFTNDDLNWLHEIQTLLVGGEALSQNTYDKLKKLTTTKIINVYGPTETCIWSSSLLINESERLSIGKPLKNESIYILTDNKGLQPLGIIGEIFIGGDGLARGYLNRPDLTEDKFIKNPFKEGERIYKTGDLGRWLPDGSIEFIGRKDDQVKIRGYRIELGEIENALNSYELIGNSVVIAKANQAGEKELVAYITGKQSLNVQELRTHLISQLPGYMVPGYFVQLESIPLNANGKVNKKQLPSPEGLGIASGIEYVAPINDTEQKLVSIWEDVLNLKNISVKDNFFDLGGSSIKIIKMITIVNRSFNKQISIATAFQHPNIKTLGEYISNNFVLESFNEDKMNSHESTKQNLKLIKPIRYEE